MRCGNGCRRTESRAGGRTEGGLTTDQHFPSFRPSVFPPLSRAPHRPSLVPPAGEPGLRRQARFAHAREGIMRKILIAVIGLAAVGGCARKPETQAAVDSTSRNIQLPKPDSAVALNDRPAAPPEAPPAAAPKEATRSE